MEYLRRMHALPVPEGRVKSFDDVEEGKKLMRIASATKGNLMREFGSLIEKIERLKAYVKQDAERMGIRPVLCHNDTYEPNYLAAENGELYLIDWEYAGMNDPANDLACMLARYPMTEERTAKFLKAYFQRELTPDENRHFRAYIPICGFYWFCWGLYKGSVGDDDGFFMLPAYRSCTQTVDQALLWYEEA